MKPDLTGGSGAVEEKTSAPDHRIELDSAAQVWTEALPLGNGHLATMCFGGPGEDRFALNHDTLWSGSPASERLFGATRQEASEALAQAKSALAAGDRVGTDEAVQALQAGHSQAYLPLGNLFLRRANAPELVTRVLDFADAVHTTTAEDGTYRRTYVSTPDGVLVTETEFPEPTDLTVEFSHPLYEVSRETSYNTLEVHVRAASEATPEHAHLEKPRNWESKIGDTTPVQAVVRVVVDTDGEVRADDGALAVSDATHVRIILVCETTFTALGKDPEEDISNAHQRAVQRIDDALALSSEELLTRHVTDHRALYDRFELALPAADDAGDLNTSDRLRAARATGSPMASDPALAALLVHYGRYLMIASSRPGTLPATLQGVWNEELQPPWNSNYTVNINTEMNYWGVETAALGECHEPMSDLVNALSDNGAEVADRLYGARGWVAHHNTDGCTPHRWGVESRTPRGRSGRWQRPGLRATWLNGCVSARPNRSGPNAPKRLGTR